MTEVRFTIVLDFTVKIVTGFYGGIVDGNGRDGENPFDHTVRDRRKE